MKTLRYSIDILRSVRVHTALQGLVLLQLTTHGRKDAEEAEADPEGAVGRESSGTEDLAAARLPHACQQLRDAACMQKSQNRLPPRRLVRQSAASALSRHVLQLNAYQSRWRSSR